MKKLVCAVKAVLRVVDEESELYKELQTVESLLEQRTLVILLRRDDGTKRKIKATSYEVQHWSGLIEFFNAESGEHEVIDLIPDGSFRYDGGLWDFCQVYSGILYDEL